eukprot:gene47696-63959_t
MGDGERTPTREFVPVSRTPQIPTATYQALLGKLQNLGFALKRIEASLQRCRGLRPSTYGVQFPRAAVGRSALAESDVCLLKRWFLKQAITVVQPTSGSSTADLRRSCPAGRLLLLFNQRRGLRPPTYGVHVPQG